MDKQRSVSRHSLEETSNLELGAAPTKTASEGYEKLARLMSLSSETAIFRRFQALNVTNVLRLQAELQDMEHELAEIRSDDAQSTDPYDLLVAIGKKLQEYNTALAQALELGRTPRPTPREVRFLRDWLARPSLGNNFLSDIEGSTWGATNESDFLTLSPRTIQKDAFTSLLNGALLDVYHRVWGHKWKQASSPFPNTGFRDYDETRMTTISNSLAAILSSLLPTLAILVFYFIKSMLIRIVLTIIFTAMFSLALSVFTEARKVEIFSATAAFAAVEVVFVGSSTNGTG